MGKSQRIPKIVLLFAALILVGGVQLAHADEIAAPPVVQPVQPILGPPADRFTPADVAAAPPPSGLLPPAPPAFQRQPCQAGACIELPAGLSWDVLPNTPGGFPTPAPGELPES